MSIDNRQVDSAAQTPVLLGVDVGGTFTDLVAFDGKRLSVRKIPSTPPDFEKAVVEITSAALGDSRAEAQLVHGSTVATNALLQRAGEPIAFITTAGFSDMLLIGRQNRPKLYALRVERARPITPAENWFTVDERIDAWGNVVRPLDEAAAHRLIDSLVQRKLQHVAVCLLFSFINPVHEQKLGELCAAAGLTVSLSSQVMPEFREYERASTTAINASLRPTVAKYLGALSGGLDRRIKDVRIMHSGGGTLSIDEAQKSAARLVLSGPAGGVIGAAFVAGRAELSDIITYDMGGTSTDVAIVQNGQPQWTTANKVDDLPLALAMFDIHAIGAGGGSIARVDAGGALRVGPQSAGALPGPACCDRGGTEPTVTDANLVLGRILPDRFLGGAMKIRIDLGQQAIDRLASRLELSREKTALGIVRIAEANMERAVRAVSSERGHDPRRFALVSFGGAGGLHACALAAALEIDRVLIPHRCGVLSALGMVVASPVVDVSKTVVHLGSQLDDARIAAEYGWLNRQASDALANEQTSKTEAFADVRFTGQSYELQVPVNRPAREAIKAAFRRRYEESYGHVPSGRPAEIVTLRLRRTGYAPKVELPDVDREPASNEKTELIDSTGARVKAAVTVRGGLIEQSLSGPALLIDREATSFIPAGWTMRGRRDGSVLIHLA